MNKNQPKKETNDFTQVWFNEIKPVEEAAEKYVSKIFADNAEDEIAKIAQWDFMSGADYVVKALKHVLSHTNDIEEVKKTLKYLKKKKTSD